MSREVAAVVAEEEALVMGSLGAVVSVGGFGVVGVGELLRAVQWGWLRRALGFG